MDNYLAVARQVVLLLVGLVGAVERALDARQRLRLVNSGVRLLHGAIAEHLGLKMARQLIMLLNQLNVYFGRELLRLLRRALGHLPLDRGLWFINGPQAGSIWCNVSLSLSLVPVAQ